MSEQIDMVRVQKRRTFIKNLIWNAKKPITSEEICDEVMKEGLGAGKMNLYTINHLSYDLKVIRRYCEFQFRCTADGYTADPDYITKYSADEYISKPKAVQKNRTLPKESIADIAKAAREAGLSYGQYLSRIRMNEQGGMNHK